MKKEFTEKQIISMTLPDDEEYELKDFKSKKYDSCLYFSKKEFEKYQEEHDVRIVGNIRIRQKIYKYPERANNPEKLIKRKQKKGIIGVCRLKLDHDYFFKRFKCLHWKYYDYKPYQCFDLYESGKHQNRCCGYAWVGEKQFVRLTKCNLLWILLLLLLIAGLILGLKSCSTPDEPVFDEGDGKPVFDEDTTSEDNMAENYGVFLWDQATVTEDKRIVWLKNYEKNDVYLTYNILDENNELLDSTGAIVPGEGVDYDFYRLFNGKKGTYKLTLYIESYDLKTKEPCDTRTIPVEIIVK